MKPIAYELNYIHETTHWWFLARREILIDIIRQWIQKNKPDESLTILDYGCGTGALTQALTPFGQVSGVDFSPVSIAFCQERGMENVRQIASAAELPAETYDIIGSFDVLEHIKEDIETLTDLKRALKPDGLLILAVPAMPVLWSGEDVVSNHLRRYSKIELQEKVEAAGFTIQRITYFNSLLFLPVFFVRIFNGIFRPQTLFQSDVSPVWPPVNKLCYHLFAFEKFLLKFINFPAGVSLLVIAGKK